MNIKLHYSDAKSFRNPMPELNIGKNSRIYGVGYFAVKDKNCGESFMALAKKGDIVGLTTWCYWWNLLYAIIAEVSGVYKLYIISSPEDFYSSEQCIYSRVLENINIEGYELNAEEKIALKKLQGECKMTFLEFMKTIIFLR